MRDLEMPLAPSSPDLGAIPSIMSITEAATSPPAPSLRMPRFPPPHAFRMKRVITEPDLAGCALCCRELSGVADRKTIAHVNLCWQRLKNKAKAAKRLKNKAEEEGVDECPCTARIILSDSGRKPPSGTLRASPSLFTPARQALSLPPGNVPETVCILCHTPLHHLSALDAFEHRLDCLNGLVPDTCPLCHEHFSVVWSKDDILWHLYACQNDCHTSHAARKAWANLIKAISVRRAVAFQLLNRTFGPRKHWTQCEQRRSFRDKRDFSRSGDAVVYSMPYTSLRRVQQIIPSHPFHSGVEMEVTTVKRVKIGPIDPMTIFLRHSFSVMKLPQMLARRRYLPETICKETV